MPKIYFHFVHFVLDYLSYILYKRTIETTKKQSLIWSNGVKKMANVAKQRPSISKDQFLLVFSEDDISANIAGPLTWQQIMKEIDQVSNPSKIHSYNVKTMQGKDITEDCAWSILSDLDHAKKLNVEDDLAPFIADSDALEIFKGWERQDHIQDLTWGTMEQQNCLTYRDVA